MKITKDELEKMITTAVDTALPNALKKVADELAQVEEDEVDVIEEPKKEEPTKEETKKEEPKPDPTIKNIKPTAKKTLADLKPRAREKLNTLLMGKLPDDKEKDKK